MDSEQLKYLLIEELGSLPYKDKKIIKEAGTIPNDLLERLMLKNSKRKKFNGIMLIVMGILILLSMILSYFYRDVSLSFTLFGSLVLIQILQLTNHPDYINNTKKELIFKLFKSFHTTDKEI